MNIVIVGHVDHGKSTIIGRMLADTGSLPQGKLDQVKAFCEKNARPFEYAFLLDALRDERAQGITIDVARVFFKTAKRSYVINDAPGHIEFLKNMVSGASHADAALLVIDGNEGIQENSRRHAYLLSMLGIRQIVVLVNKMDLLKYDEKRFQQIVADFGTYLKNIDVRPLSYIPVVGVTGENVSTRSSNMPWYKGSTVLETLDGFTEAKPLSDTPFRMPVQDVYKFTAQGDTRRIIAGTVESGVANVGDEVVFYPSRKKSRIRSIESFPQAQTKSLSSGTSGGFTLDEQLYVSRGELAGRAGEQPPECSSHFKTSIFWLGKRPLHTGKDYYLKIGSTRARAWLEKITRVLDASSLTARPNAQTVARHEVAECTFRLARPIAYDLDQLTPGTSRFVLVDDFEIAGGGIIRETLPVDTTTERAARFQQQSLIVLLAQATHSGPHDHGLELALSDRGRAVFQLPAAADPVTNETLLKLSDKAKLLLDAGLIVLIPVSGFHQADIEFLKAKLPKEKLRVAWLGTGQSPTHIPADLSADPKDEQTLLETVLNWTAI